MTNVPKQISAKFEKELLVANALWDLLPVGEEQMPFGAPQFARLVDLNGMRHHLIAAYVDQFITDGLIRRRGPIYGDKQNGLSPGRNYGWTLEVDKETALLIINARHEAEAETVVRNYSNGGKKGAAVRAANRKTRKAASKAARERGTYEERVAVATSDEEATRAIAGPEPVSAIGVELRKIVPKLNNREAEALVEAARQYTNRASTIDSSVEQLAKVAAEVGINFDRATIMSALSFETDERLETVGLVLPVIDALQAQIDRQNDAMLELRRKYADYDQTKRELRALREGQQQKIAARVSVGH